MSIVIDAAGQPLEEGDTAVYINCPRWASLKHEIIECFNGTHKIKLEGRSRYMSPRHIVKIYTQET